MFQIQCEKNLDNVLTFLALADFSTSPGLLVCKGWSWEGAWPEQLTWIARGIFHRMPWDWWELAGERKLLLGHRSADMNNYIVHHFYYITCCFIFNYYYFILFYLVIKSFLSQLMNSALSFFQISFPSHWEQGGMSTAMVKPLNWGKAMKCIRSQQKMWISVPLEGSLLSVPQTNNSGI